MIYKKFKPNEILQQFVECYFIWESIGDAITNLVIESPPSGFCSIVFNNGDDYFLQNKKYERLAVPRQFIAGQSIYSYKLFLNGDISMAGIVFKPAALATLFNLPTFEYTEERISLDKVFKESYLNSIIEKIQHAGDANEKVKHLEAFVLDHYYTNKPEPDYIDFAANTIVEKNGMIQIPELMKEVFMSRRQFERKFFNKVGLSPKYYARLRRMAYLMNLIAGKKKVNWSAVFVECQFYDQSHFIKDFIEFTGRSPQQYLEANEELVNFITRPKTNSIQP